MTPEQTLDWLAQQHWDQCREDRPIQDWIRKMKVRLPEQAQKQEPVAWIRRHPNGALSNEVLIHVQVEPVRRESGAWVPLYTSPPQRQPLTDEAILLGAKALAKRHADSCELDFDDVWKYYADEHKDDAKAVLLAAHSTKGEA